jgi:uncharacterized membrane protein
VGEEHGNRGGTLTNWTKIIAGVACAAGIAIIAYALLAPQPANDTQTDHMGMYGPHSTYSSQNVLIMAVGVIAIVAGLMVIFLREEYEPLPPTLVLPQAPAVDPSPPPSPKHEKEDIATKEYLALRLLTGDERTMFKAIMDSGGEALQKDLILQTRMSNAKVSRLLDRLQAKGVVSKDRHGSTNKIRIKIDS